MRGWSGLLFNVTAACQGYRGAGTLLLALVVAVSSCAAARGPFLVTIRGTVLTKAQHPMVRAQVLVAGTGLAAETDDSGHFELAGALEGGRQHFRAQCIGYAPVERIIHVKRAELVNIGVVILKERAIQLDDPIMR